MTTTRRIDRYVVEQMLGHGGLGTVYLAQDPKLNRKVAIKVLTTEAEEPSLRSRFQMEARAVASLRHPNIVQLYDYSDEDSPLLFLVMEYVPGKSLLELLQQRGPMTEQTALCIGHEIAEALAHAHSHRLIHRDIKPGNVLLHQGRVVLLDFGSVKVLGVNPALGVNKARPTTQVIGTPGFMAPEQFEGKAIDARTDVFALGALLYNLATDALPYHGSDMDDPDECYDAARSGAYRDPREYQPLLTPGYCELLSECLSSRARERIDDIKTVARRIRALLDAHGIVDVGSELTRYEAEPTRAATEQQVRTIDALVRELKTALLRQLQASLKDKDRARAKVTLRRLQYIAPLDELEGKSPSGKSRRLLVGGTHRRQRRLAFLGGMLLGAGLTAAVSFWLKYLLVAV